MTSKTLRYWPDFFVEALDPESDIQELLEEPTGRPTRVSRLALDRMSQSSEAAGVRIDDAFLRQLDESRDSDPATTAREARRWLRRAPLVAVARLLAIHGSAKRVAGKLEEAHDNLLHALGLAKAMGDKLLCADIRLRLGVVHAYMGNLAIALRFAQQATLDYMLEGDEHGIGRGLADQGMWLYRLGHIQDAIKATRRAVAHFRENAHRQRFAALAALAHRYRHLGEISQARLYLERARELTPHVSPGASRKVLWIEAQIEVDLGNYERADQLYNQVVEIYRQLSPIDAALAAVELVRNKLMQGQYEAASQTASSLVTFLTPLKNSRVACSAILELLRVANSGNRLTVRQVDGLSQTLQKVRARPGAAPGSALSR